MAPSIHFFASNGAFLESLSVQEFLKIIPDPPSVTKKFKKILEIFFLLFIFYS